MIFWFACASLLLSCQDDYLENETTTNYSTSNSSFKPNLAFQDLQNGEVMEGYYLGRPITYAKHKGHNVFEGDILIRDKDIHDHAPELTTAPDGVKSTSRSVGRVNGLWPNNIVYYTIESSLPNQSRIHEAIKHWESKTHLKFKVRTSQSNYIYFRAGNGCSSYVGMQGGKQSINLADACHTGAVIHEIGHAVGLYHEQNRIDRDEYVKIHYENITPRMAFNFDSVLKGPHKAKDYTDEMDFESVMLYDSYAFSENGKPTITKLNGETFRGYYNELSEGDIIGINQMYPEITGGGDDDDDDNEIINPAPPTYKNNTWYTIDGLLVYRQNDKWYYWHSWYRKWYEVVNINGQWFYKR